MVCSWVSPVHNIHVDCRTGIMNNGLYLGEKEGEEEEEEEEENDDIDNVRHESMKQRRYFLRDRLMLTSQ